MSHFSLHNKKSRLKWILAAIFLLFILREFNFSGSRTKKSKTPVIPRAVTPAPESLGANERSTIEVFDQISPSVVSIENAAYRREFFSLNIYEIPQGAGSGFVWDTDGHIITNFHVIYKADKIDVVLSNNSYDAKVVGIAPDYDLAVLKILAPAEELKPIPLARSQDLRVGQTVLAIGNPFGLDRSLSKGVISALGRSIRSLTGHEIDDVIQTDTAINPGNSGGPLLDSFGRLIGVTTAIYSPSGASAGIGFAVPADTINRIVPQLISNGKITRVGLGVALAPDNIRAHLDLKGSLILKVLENSAAHKAGLKGTSRDLHGDLILGDLIVAVDGHEIKDNDDLSSFFDKGKSVGDTVVVIYIRDEKHYETTVVLQEL